MLSVEAEVDVSTRVCCLATQARALQQQQQQQLPVGLSPTIEFLVVHTALALLAVAVCLPGGLRSSTAHCQLRHSLACAAVSIIAAQLVKAAPTRCHALLAVLTSIVINEQLAVAPSALHIWSSCLAANAETAATQPRACHADELISSQAMLQQKGSEDADADMCECNHPAAPDTVL
jgi:hypothetical protein